MTKIYTNFIANCRSFVFTFFLTILLFSSIQSKALVNSYGFTHTVGSYAPISGGTLLGDNATDDQRFVEVSNLLGSTSILTGAGFPIGFNFTYDGVVYDVFGVNANGWIALGNNSLVDVSAPNYGPISGTGGSNTIAAFARDIQAQSSADIQFLTIGTAPNQTLVVQWTNYKKYGTNGTGDSFDFQIRLNESNNSIDFVYGNFVVNTNPDDLQCGLRGLSPTDYINREITSNWAASVLGGSNAATCALTSTVYPANGTTYSWTIPLPCVAPPTAGVAIASPSSSCPNIPFALTLTGSTVASALSYQWQSSSNNTSWLNITGATALNYSTSQTSSTYYRCIVICSGVADTSTFVFVTTNNFASCYCNSGATSTVDDDIGNVTFGSINNGIGTPATQNSTATNTYTDFTSLPVQTFLQGLNYPIEITQINSAGFYACQVYVYIDYNQDGIYDPNSESVFNGTTNAGTGGNVVSGNVTIPLTSLSGNTGMRVVLVEGTFNTVTPCGTYTWGETEDYIVNIMAATPCSAPANAGAAISSQTAVCPNIPFNLNLQGSAINSGLSYQWQDSISGAAWTNIAGANSINYQTAQTVNTYYRCIVTCTGVNSYSSSVYVTVNGFFNCYCNSTATSTGDDDIGNVTFGLLNNGIATPATQNASSVNMYSDFTNLPPFSYIQTLTYPISVTQINLNGFYVCSGAVFIDFDHDGVFDPSTETVLAGTTSAGAGTISGTYTIPTTSLPGITRMRVVLKEGANPPASPCGTYTWGETEDYLVNILFPNSCSIPFLAGIAKSSLSSVCSDDIFMLSLDSLPPDTGFTFQWQKSLDNINWTDISGATIQIYSGSQSFDTWYRCNVTCNGGTTVSSIAVQVINKPVTQCDYCHTGISGNCSIDYYIDSLAIGGTTFNNAATGCAANAGFAYSRYPINGNTTTDLARGNYYDMYVKTKGSCNISVWIDYDQSGTFDENEWIQVSQATDTILPATVPLVIPAVGLAKLGTTGMRVRSRKAGNLNLGADACSAYGSGETEDYYITLVDAISTGKELDNSSNFQIFPNPSNGIVTIDFREKLSKTFQIKVLNAEGQLVYSEAESNFKGSYKNTLDFSNFSKGIYFVQFVTDNKVLSKKMILQ
jgi:hypothetical protein